MTKKAKSDWCIEMVNPLTIAFNDHEMIVEMQTWDRDNTNNSIVIMPLHEDFYDMCREYCKAYKVYIQKKMADE